MRIGIVGAGAAGLAAAYDLSRAGHEVTVHESAPFIGGQAFDDTGWRVSVGAWISPPFHQRSSDFGFNG